MGFAYEDFQYPIDIAIVMSVKQKSKQFKILNETFSFLKKKIRKFM